MPDMVLSLQEQLKKSGLVDDKKAKQLERARRKEEKLARQRGSGKGKKETRTAPADERARELERIKSEQIAKDRQLNEEKNARAQRNAVKAQIKQLIEINAIAHGGTGPAGEKKYSFADANKIRHLWVSPQQVDQLSQGSIVIVRQVKKYVLVPAAVADKIAQRDPGTIVFRAEKSMSTPEDDPYADYKIPDDLDW